MTDKINTASKTSRQLRARRRRLARSCRLVFEAVLILSVIATQDHDWSRSASGGSSSAATKATNSAKLSAPSRWANGVGARSVQAAGSVTCPAGPPSQTSTRSAPRRLFSNSTAKRCPANGWNGWVTTTESETGLDLEERALCEDRRDAERPGLPRLARLGDEASPTSDKRGPPCPSITHPTTPTASGSPTPARPADRTDTRAVPPGGARDMPGPDATAPVTSLKRPRLQGRPPSSTKETTSSCSFPSTARPATTTTVLAGGNPPTGVPAPVTTPTSDRTDPAPPVSSSAAVLTADKEAQWKRWLSSMCQKSAAGA